jgi:hypothetical protein
MWIINFICLRKVSGNMETKQYYLNAIHQNEISVENIDETISSLKKKRANLMFEISDLILNLRRDYPNCNIRLELDKSER